MLDKCNYRLKPYKLENCRDAFKCIVEWAGQHNGDVKGAFMATTRLSQFCRVVESVAGQFSAVIYPDFKRFDGEVLIVHSVLSVAALRAYRGQVQMLEQYITEMFEQHPFRKVVLEFPSISRLSGRMAEKVGMVKEATIRQEWRIGDKYYDIIRYSVLRTEWEARDGWQKRIS